VLLPGKRRVSPAGIVRTHTLKRADQAPAEPRSTLNLELAPPRLRKMVANKTTRFAFDWWIIEKRFVYLMIAIFLACATAGGAALRLEIRQSLQKRRRNELSGRRTIHLF
jgi:hypothetical protein